VLDDHFDGWQNVRMNLVFKALSDPTRRQVLELLRKGPMSAGQLAECFDLSKPTMSAHFGVLRKAGLISAERRGKSIVYELRLSVLEDALLGFAGIFGWTLQESKRGRVRLSRVTNEER
jgi:DNA-binding transcriptional ArsR family regulator